VACCVRSHPDPDSVCGYKRFNKALPSVRQSAPPGFAQPAYLAGRAKQTRQRTLTKPPHNSPDSIRFNSCMVVSDISNLQNHGYHGRVVELGS
jgi:hypothetical protein